MENGDFVVSSPAFRRNRPVRKRQKGTYCQPRVEDGQAEIVPKQVKVRNPHTGGRIKDRYVHVADRDAGPGGPDEHLHFKSIAAFVKIQALKDRQRISPKAALGIADSPAGLNAEPEIRERSAET